MTDRPCHRCGHVHARNQPHIWTEQDKPTVRQAIRTLLGSRKTAMRAGEIIEIVIEQVDFDGKTPAPIRIRNELQSMMDGGQVTRPQWGHYALTDKGRRMLDEG